MFKKWPIDILNDNIIEMLKNSSIEQSFDNWMCVINPRNADFDDLPFYCDESLITRRWIYRINDDIVEGLNNGSSV